MSVLPVEVGSALAELLHELSSSENVVRALAEERLNTEWAAARPDVLLMGLVEQIQVSQDPAVGTLSRLTALMNLEYRNILLISAIDTAATFLCFSTLPTHCDKVQKTPWRRRVERALFNLAASPAYCNQAETTGMLSK